ncbi:MAG TPA: hypothetical protein VF194_11040 [Ferrovibrio sp.]
MPLGQEIYLGGLLIAFLLFSATLSFGMLTSSNPDLPLKRPPH